MQYWICMLLTPAKRPKNWMWLFSLSPSMATGHWPVDQEKPKFWFLSNLYLLRPQSPKYPDSHPHSRFVKSSYSELVGVVKFVDGQWNALHINVILVGLEFAVLGNSDVRWFITGNSWAVGASVHASVWKCSCKIKACLMHGLKLRHCGGSE